MTKASKKSISSLKNYFLLAMPGLNDPNFAHSVVYICEHNAEGAMGLIINQQLDIPVKAIFDQLELSYLDECGNSLIFDGGPVQRDRGFILHSSVEQQWESTVAIGEDISLTASKDILTDIALGKGPTNALITLGYSSWEAGQLEQELTQNSWLTIPADSAIIFHTDCAKRAGAAASTIGLDLAMLSHDAGHA
ncbi:MAG: YqgE/AlgH family protein [Porticoccaceae bacterium]|jgi:putative transcriptional regulator|nr:YqgE/AlgH family protein [Porticoccaceae bacterium]